MLTLTSVTVPTVACVVRPFFFTVIPSRAVSGVGLSTYVTCRGSTLANDVHATATSTRFGPGKIEAQEVLRRGDRVGRRLPPVRPARLDDRVARPRVVGVRHDVVVAEDTQVVVVEDHQAPQGTGGPLRVPDGHATTDRPGV